jgi:hypothetical protein
VRFRIWVAIQEQSSGPCGKGVSTNLVVRDAGWRSGTRMNHGTLIIIDFSPLAVSSTRTQSTYRTTDELDFKPILNGAHNVLLTDATSSESATILSLASAAHPCSTSAIPGGWRYDLLIQKAYCCCYRYDTIICAESGYDQPSE